MSHRFWQVQSPLRGSSFIPIRCSLLAEIVDLLAPLVLNTRAVGSVMQPWLNINSFAQVVAVVRPAPAAPNTVVNEILMARPCAWTLDTLDKQ